MQKQTIQNSEVLSIWQRRHRRRAGEAENDPAVQSPKAEVTHA
jgi:hypothetical protein